MVVPLKNTKYEVIIMANTNLPYTLLKDYTTHVSVNLLQRKLFKKNPSRHIELDAEKEYSLIKDSFAQDQI